MSKRTLLPFNLVLASALICGGAQAAELVSNGDFSADTSNWRRVGRGTITHNADGSGGAGSLDAEAGLAGGASHALAGQCISGVSGGQALVFSADLRVTVGSPDYCRIAVFESQGDGCLWITLGSEVRRTAFSGGWDALSGGSFTTAAATGSLEIRLHCANSDGDTGALEVRFDDVSVDTVGLPSTIFEDDFESDDTSEWSSTTP